MDDRRRTYEIRLVTPAFVAGADPQRPAIRVPSIRGCLRWWWRLGLKAEGHLLDEIAKQEADLFGSTANGQRLVLRLGELRKGEPKPLDYQRLTFDHKYLWFSLRPDKGSPIRRPAVAAGTVFRLEAIVPSHLADASRRLECVDRAVSLWVLGGALGHRSRRGAGSLWFATRLPSGGPLPEGADAIGRLLRETLRALASIVDVQVSRDAYPTWEKALEAAGGRYRGRRLWLKDQQGRAALPALGWPILNFPGAQDSKLQVDGHKDGVERLGSPVWIKVVPDGSRFRWLLLVIRDPFAQRARSGVGEVVLSQVLRGLASGFEGTKPPPAGSPNR
jgi:CRISPR type III-B/RAMP module RAMP protein Cmr1